MLGQLVDWIAAIEQHALIAIDEGDPGLAARRRGEARVIGEIAGLRVKRGDVDDVRAKSARADRELMATTPGHQGRLGRDRFVDLCDAHRGLLGSRMMGNEAQREFGYILPAVPSST